MANLNLCMSYGLSPFIQDASIEAIKNDKKTIKEIKSKLKHNRKIMMNIFYECSKIKFFSKENSMFALLDFREYGISSTKIAWNILNKVGVSLLPCDSFGKSGEGFLRVSLCNNFDNTKEAARRIKKFVNL